MAENNKRTGINRRTFLKLLGGLGAGALVLKFLKAPAGSEKVLIEISMKKIPESGALMYPEHNIALVRSGDNVKALSLSCTHLGCTVLVKGDKFLCPCHGSSFRFDGGLIKGPAERGLDTHRTILTGRSVKVFEGKENV
ncbi:MAG: cytochrome B6 [Denitrovibrio sp.]|nr:MAG: cytochrome B6 [Denitrovibrio sp.]